MTPNPFAPSHNVANERSVFGEARLIRSTFLFRIIEFDSPLQFRMVYDGWWFRQKIEISGKIAWFQISWLTIQRRVEFRIPATIDPRQPAAAIEIDFGQGLRIRRFRVWVSEQIVYDEIS